MKSRESLSTSKVLVALVMILFLSRSLFGDHVNVYFESGGQVRNCVFYPDTGRLDIDHSNDGYGNHEVHLTEQNGMVGLSSYKNDPDDAYSGGSGYQPLSTTVKADEVKYIYIDVGEGHDVVDLRDIGPHNFPNLELIYVDPGPGGQFDYDEIIGSPHDDLNVLLGRPEDHDKIVNFKWYEERPQSSSLTRYPQVEWLYAKMGEELYILSLHTEVWKYDWQGNEWEAVSTYVEEGAWVDLHDPWAVSSWNSIFIGGGMTPTGPNGSIIEYDPATSTWSQAYDFLASQDRAPNMATVTGDGRLVLTDVRTANGMPTNETWIYDPMSNTAVRGADFPGQIGGIYGAQTACLGGSLYVFGVPSGGAPFFSMQAAATDTDAPYSTGYRYDAASDAWSAVEISGEPMPARSFAASAQTSEKAYVFGGLDEDTFQPMSDIWVFDANNLTTKRIGEMPFSGANMTAVVVDPNHPRVLFFGGHVQPESMQGKIIVYMLPGIEQTLARIDLTPAELTLQLGQTQQFTAVAYDTNDTEIDVPLIWTANLGTIDPNGLYTATETGTGSVAAFVNRSSVTATAEVHVEATPQ